MKARRLAAMGSLLVVACNANGHEARALTQALDQFSLATPSDRARALAALEAVPVTAYSTAENAKRECIVYARALHQALSLKDEVALRFADVRSGLIEKSDPVAIALPTKLDDAERSLKEAAAVHPECRRLLAAAAAR